MKYEYVVFKPEHIPAAADLAAVNYADALKKCRHLPRYDVGLAVRNALVPLQNHAGLAVMAGGRLAAYMIAGFNFQFKSQNAMILREFCHASVKEDRAVLYQRMYMELAGDWLRKGMHLQCIGYLSHDAVLKETLHQIGFGAILAERVRDLSDIAGVPKVEIAREENPEKLIAIQLEHNKYYQEPPIFIVKSHDREQIKQELYGHQADGDAFLVYYRGSTPYGYFIVGKSEADGEGFLLRETNTAQIKSAYIKPEVRGQGIGKALLQQAVAWARANGYERLFVEHETANYYGGRFWAAHFQAYLQYAMRYIDTLL